MSSRTASRSQTKIKSAVRDPKPLTRAQVVARKEAIRDWIAQRDESEYVIPPVEAQQAPPTDSLPEGYEPDWRVQSVPMPDVAKWGERR